MVDNNQNLEITAVRALNPRSLRLEFNNGDVRLFDSHRLRGPAFIPLMNEEIFTKPIVTEDGKLYLNPGSCGRRRADDTVSYVEMTADQGRWTLNHRTFRPAFHM